MDTFVGRFGRRPGKGVPAGQAR